MWNRAGFHALHQHELELARASDQRIGIIYSDIDHFKRINDTLGHRAGDSVLREAASRLRAALRPEDLLARFGGEEFVVMVRVRETTELTMIANRIRELMEATPIELCRHVRAGDHQCRLYPGRQRRRTGTGTRPGGCRAVRRQACRTQPGVVSV